MNDKDNKKMFSINDIKKHYYAIFDTYETINELARELRKTIKSEGGTNNA